MTLLKRLNVAPETSWWPFLDQQGVAIRTGDNCAQPLMKKFNIPGTARASFSIYNTLDEVDVLLSALRKAHMMLA